jgi:hypothetical protein
MYLGAAALQADGTAFVGGYAQATSIDFGSGPLGGYEYAYFATLDSGLNLKNALAVNDHGLDQMRAIATPDGTGFVVTGVIDRDGVDLGGGALTYTGANQRGGGQNNDLFLAEFTTGLQHVFSHSYGDTSSQNPIALCADPDGTISWLGTAGFYTSFDGQVVSGDPNTPDDGFIVRINPQGVAQVAGSLPTGGDQLGCAPGAYALVGRYPPSGDGTVDFGAGPVAEGRGFFLRRNRF